jgi:hypothetical protein
MSALAPNYLVLLQRNLSEKYLPYLPPLLDQNKPSDQLEKKNLSRAFSAFALHHLTGIDEIRRRMRWLMTLMILV